ncbi:hypothetical protein Tco_0946669 [Tanacetum coccineum]
MYVCFSCLVGVVLLVKDCRMINLIMEYLVNISKRRKFWSLNEDILKITILKTNTSYPSRKIRRIHACTHQRPQRSEAQYAVSRDSIRRIQDIISKDLCLKTNDELDRMSRVPYASAVGSIMYAMTCTTPDVSFALSMVSRHQQNPGEGHWTAGAVTRKSLKQDTVADFTCESEYIAACEASKEAIWMKNFIGDLGVVPTSQDLIEILCDSKSAVALTKNPMITESQSILKENTILFKTK